MPICPRCGKQLTSDQALTYHLNRKYKCNSWKCSKCEKSCNTRLDLQMHEMHCETSSIEPSIELLKKVYRTVPGLVHVYNSSVTMSPTTRSLFRIKDDVATVDDLKMYNHFKINAINDSIFYLSPRI